MAAKRQTTKPRPGRTESKTPHMTIAVVTESTGGLARHTMNTVLTQFPDSDLRVEYHNFVDSKKSIQDAIVGLRPHVDVVVSTLADTDLKHFMVEQADQIGLDHFDITGGLIEMIADVSGGEPVNDSSVIHRQDKEYFDRMDALEFTLQHDDGRRLETIHQADLVLVGLSRVSKTPTSAYLGWIGYRVANVSICREAGFPEELDQCSEKIIALTISPQRLAEIRKRRMEVNRFQQKLDELSDSELGYTDLRDVIREVMYAENEYKKRRYPMIDITNRTVEETAALAMEHLQSVKRKAEKGQTKSKTSASKTTRRKRPNSKSTSTKRSSRKPRNSE